MRAPTLPSWFPRAALRPGLIHVLALVTLPLLAWALYARALHGPFVFDDPNTIVINPRIRALTPLSAFVGLDRPLSDLSFAINYAIGGLRPYGYHLTNLLLHMLNGLLVYALVYRTLSVPTVPALLAKDGDGGRLSHATSPTSPDPSLGDCRCSLTWPLDTAPLKTGPIRGERIFGALWADVAPVTPSSRLFFAAYRGAHLFIDTPLVRRGNDIETPDGKGGAASLMGPPLGAGEASAEKSSATAARAAPAIALATAALFIAHPLQSEAVAYVSSRSELLVATFYLLSVWVYATAATTRRFAVRLATALVLPVTVTAAFASKEIAVTLPLALLLYDWCFIACGSLRRFRARWWLLCLPLLPVAAGAVRALSRPFVLSAGFSMQQFTKWEYLWTQFGVILRYLRLTLWPAGQCFDYDWPLAHTPWSSAVLLPAAALGVLVIAAIACFRRQPLCTFAILWTLLVLAPTSSILPIADVIAERRMYLALLGPLWLAAAWTWAASAWLARRRGRGRAGGAAVYAALIGAALCTLSPLTTARAALWADPLALHLDGVARAPRNPRIWMNLGVVYMNLNRIDDAQAALQKAQQLYDRQESLHAQPTVGAFIAYNLGAVLYARHQDAAATAQLQRALQLGGAYKAVYERAQRLLADIAARQNAQSRQ